MKLRLSILAAGIAATALALPVQAQFAERTIRLSNGVNQEHPVGNGVAKMAACTAEKSGGKKARGLRIPTPREVEHGRVASVA